MPKNANVIKNFFLLDPLSAIALEGEINATKIDEIELANPN